MKSATPELKEERAASPGRRSFLTGMSGAAIVSALPWKSLYGAAADVTPAARRDGRVAIAFGEPVDVLICGSTLFACQLAIDAARAGKRTMLVMDRVNPLYEGVACLRAWVDTASLDRAPALMASVLGAPATREVKDGRTYFNAFNAALEVENQLCDAGVRFLYNAAVAGALGADGRLAGVVFGGKTGLFAIEAATVVDATADATVARAAGAKTSPVAGPRRYHYVADLAAPVAPRKVSYTAANGARVRVDIHHYYAGFDVELEARSSGPFALSEDFAQVYAAALECPWAAEEKRFRGADAFLGSGVDRLEAAEGRVAGLDNLLVFGPHGIAGNRDGSLVLKDPLALFAAFPRALERVQASRRPTAVPRPTYEFWNKGVAAEPTPAAGTAHSFQDHGFAEPGMTVGEIKFQPPQTVQQGDVVVVGGGTSGNAAAYACAGLGLKTICLERGLELGGTNTIGGVTKLWFGRRTPAFDDYFKAMQAANDGRNAPGFFRGVTKAGARVLFQSTITGVAQVGRTVSCIYVITPFGLTAVAAPRFIDATGDGSLAAWAGCGYTFGGEHDEMSLWASFAGYLPGRQEALRPFLSPLDERSALDTTRFILAMRRNSRAPKDAKHTPPPFFVAPRESRHIRGGKTVTFLDVLAGRRYRDGVFRMESNPDIKGLATSDAAKAGFIPTDWKRLYQVTVPYAAMIPVNLDNVIIAGKAYSVTHDALSAARMQRDLCVMGLVAGEAVKLATAGQVGLRDIPVAELQKICLAKGMLKPGEVAADDLGFGLTPEAIARKIATTTVMDEALPASAMLCLLPREQAVAALEAHVETDSPALQRVRCFLGLKPGVESYLRQVDQALSEPVLSKELYGGTATGHKMPDQGYAPTSALMLGSLAFAREPRTGPRLAKLAARVTYDEKDLRSSWGYFYSLACGYERLPDRDGVAPLQRVLGAGLFQNRVIRRHEDLRACKDTTAERLAYLRLALARALTRCGAAEGAIELCGFLDEARVCFARAARAELVAATAQDFGFRAGDWRAWIQQNGRTLRPNPLTAAFG